MNCPECNTPSIYRVQDSDNKVWKYFCNTCLHAYGDATDMKAAEQISRTKSAMFPDAPKSLTDAELIVAMADKKRQLREIEVAHTARIVAELEGRKQMEERHESGCPKCDIWSDYFSHHDLDTFCVRCGKNLKDRFVMVSTNEYWNAAIDEAVKIVNTEI